MKSCNFKKKVYEGLWELVVFCPRRGVCGVLRREGHLQGSVASAQLPPTFLLFILADQVATQFKMSLLELVEILKSKEPAYVRCIKPNDSKQPGRPSAP